MLFESLKEIYEMITSHRNPAIIMVAIASFVAIFLTCIIALVVSSDFSQYHALIVGNPVSSRELLLKLRWLAVLFVAVVLIMAVVLTGTPTSKKAYAFMAFILAAIFAFIIFIPFMAEGARLFSEVGMLMGGAIVIMILCRCAWPLAQKIIVDTGKKAFGIFKIIIALTKKK